jgi:hypothetical protein
MSQKPYIDTSPKKTDRWTDGNKAHENTVCIIAFREIQIETKNEILLHIYEND